MEVHRQKYLTIGITVDQWFSTESNLLPFPRDTDNVWRHFFVVRTGGAVLLISIYRIEIRNAAKNLIMHRMATQNKELKVEKDWQSLHLVSKCLFNSPILSKMPLLSNVFMPLGPDTLCFTLQRLENFGSILLGGTELQGAYCKETFRLLAPPFLHFEKYFKSCIFQVTQKVYNVIHLLFSTVGLGFNFSGSTSQLSLAHMLSRSQYSYFIFSSPVLFLCVSLKKSFQECLGGLVS